MPKPFPHDNPDAQLTFMKGGNMAGYHLVDIEKGTLGQFSKVVEEYREFEDACSQNCHVMALVELSDLIGSLKHYFKTHHKEHLWFDYINHINNHTLHIDEDDLRHSFEFIFDTQDPFHWEKLKLFIDELHAYAQRYNLKIFDLIKMSDITERAFISGRRK